MRRKDEEGSDMIGKGLEGGRKEIKKRREF